jgi:hypothetical protein
MRPGHYGKLDRLAIHRKNRSAIITHAHIPFFSAIEIPMTS